jgi:hypothetical protein
MPLFNRSAAADYAVKYALSPNSAFPPYSNDCTSFVSQAMLAGGWTMVGGSVFDRQDDDVWWWGKSTFSQASYTWGGADNFSRFVAASGRGKRGSRGDLGLGDVVQIAKRPRLPLDGRDPAGLLPGRGWTVHVLPYEQHSE